jgi:hypothetical protein
MREKSSPFRRLFSFGGDVGGGAGTTLAMCSLGAA